MEYEWREITTLADPWAGYTPTHLSLTCVGRALAPPGPNAARPGIAWQSRWKMSSRLLSICQVYMLVKHMYTLKGPKISNGVYRNTPGVI
jgi:hypothetical protein